MIKPIVLVVALIAAYFIFFKDPYPNSVVFDGHTFSNKNNENNSLNQNIDIVSYRSGGNHQVLVFGITDGSVALDDISALYLQRFESQGHKFKKSPGRHLSVTGDQVIYMAKASAINGVIIYVEKTSAQMHTSIDDASMMFVELENFTF